MLKRYLILFIFSINLFAGTIEQYFTMESAQLEAKKMGKDILVFFHGKNCPHCKKMMGETFKDEEVIRYINSRFVFLSVNEDRGEKVKKLSKEYYPEVFIIEPETDNVVFSGIGFSTPKEFLKALNKI